MKLSHHEMKFNEMSISEICQDRLGTNTERKLPQKSRFLCRRVFLPYRVIEALDDKCRDVQKRISVGLAVAFRKVSIWRAGKTLRVAPAQRGVPDLFNVIQSYGGGKSGAPLFSNSLLMFVPSLSWATICSQKNEKTAGKRERRFSLPQERTSGTIDFVMESSHGRYKETPPLFSECFPYVCPEPVLVN